MSIITHTGVTDYLGLGYHICIFELTIPSKIQEHLSTCFELQHSIDAR